MSAPTRKRRWLTICAITASAALVAIPAGAAPGANGSPFGARTLAQLAAERAHSVGAITPKAKAQDDGGGDDDNEADEIAEGADQYAEARTSPGIVAPGAYGAAWTSLTNLPSTGGSWHNITNLPYNSDDSRYRDYDSNSSGGSGNVTGRMAAMAADDDGYVYAGSAGGGVWRSRTGGGRWQPISDKLPSQSTGALALDGGGRLWLGTGEANTNADAYLGSGVYVLSNPHHGTFSTRSRVGGDELESTTVRQLRFGGGKVWAATSEGVWSHSTKTLKGAWKLEFAPNPDYLPGGSQATDDSAAYKNITNDIAIDPKNPSKVILAVGWRSGDDYNGFYAKTNGTWTRITSGSATCRPTPPMSATSPSPVPPTARATTPSTSRPRRWPPTPTAALRASTVSGSPFGPWTKVADYTQLAADGSALDLQRLHAGRAGLVQPVPDRRPERTRSTCTRAWRRSTRPRTAAPTGRRSARTGTSASPAGASTRAKQTGDCSPTTHSDQHGVAIGSYHGKSLRLRRQRRRRLQAPARTARRTPPGTPPTGPRSTTAPSTPSSTTRWASARTSTYGGVSVTGGLQDNGQSILRSNDTVMGSNFGGDGGDTLTDPANGCNIAQEYVYLAIQVTQNCAVNDGVWVDRPEQDHVVQRGPADNATGEARFIAPLTADAKNSSTWVAGGRHVWVQTNGYAIRSGSRVEERLRPRRRPYRDRRRGLGRQGLRGLVRPLQQPGLRPRHLRRQRGRHRLARRRPSRWTATVPNRYLAGFAIDPKNADHVYLAVNGFSRHWTEGPGAGVGHVFESTDGGTTWKDISENLPDVPTNSAVVTSNGGLAVATDLGVVYRAPGRTTWQRVGSLPAVAVLQLKLSPDGKTLYAATHGRGIYTIKVSDCK